MVSYGVWDSSLGVKDKWPGATWSTLVLIFYLPESGQESSAWSSLVGKHFILLRRQSLTLLKAFSKLCSCTFGSQNHISGWVCWEQGYLCLQSVLTQCPLMFSLTRNSVPHCISLTLSLVSLCRLVPFPLTALLLFTLQGLVYGSLLQEDFHEPHSLPPRGDAPHLCSYGILGSPSPKQASHITPHWHFWSYVSKIQQSPRAKWLF